jgi:polar amino acid transport system ATP-binding protein
VNRIRSYACRIASPDFDRYAMNAEIEAFCEKHIIPRDTRYNLMLVVEEVLEMLGPELGRVPVDLGVTYSEKTDAVEVTFERDGERPNPLESDQPDDLAVKIIRSAAEAVDYRVAGGRSRLAVRIGTA